MLILRLSAIITVLVAPTFALSRPPKGALVVRSNTTSSKEFSTLKAAVSALPNDTSSQTIFIYPGVYTDQVLVNRTGPLTIQGYTPSPLNYSQNTVTLAYNLSASAAGSNDLSATLRIHSNSVKLYNLNIRNTFGVGSQALALSQNGDKTGVYACGLFGFQDTLYANSGRQAYLRGYIEGAVDYIFGGVSYKLPPRAYFSKNVIASTRWGHITANGRPTDDDGRYLFEDNTIIAAQGAADDTDGRVYLGRAWRNHSRVIFKNTEVNVGLHPEVWSPWNVPLNATQDIFYAEYNTHGRGSVNATSRPDFVKILNATQAEELTIGTTLGEDWDSWVDKKYL